MDDLRIIIPKEKKEIADKINKLQSDIARMDKFAEDIKKQMYEGIDQDSKDRVLGALGNLGENFIYSKELQTAEKQMMGLQKAQSILESLNI